MSWLAIDNDEWVDVLPLDDWIGHEYGAQCVCGPTVLLETGSRPLITHDSLDGRELTEDEA